MSVYYVGFTTQFAHSELDTQGNAIPQQAGRWSVTNPAVAEITSDGLASWLAPGETEVMFTIADYRRSGAIHAVVHSAIPVTLTLAPSTITVYPGSLSLVTVTAHDSLGHLIPDLDLDSVVSSDETAARIIQIDKLATNDAPQFLVVGIAEGGATVTAVSGPVSAQANVDVLAPLQGISEADADLRYLAIGATIPDSRVTKTPRVDKGDVSGAVARVWLITQRAQRQRMVGNTVTTISGIPEGEFFFVDVEQDSVGFHTHAFVFSGLPPVEWDDEIVPTQTENPNTSDSYMFQHVGARLFASRTYFNVSTV